ncbi:MAG: DUF192 domain-containing protein [Patescibacteria group bacterium]
MQEKKLKISIFIIALLLLTSCSRVKNISQVCFESVCFNVEIADSREKQARGLMFREHLDVDKGMLFVFDKEDIYSFWMKNTLIPLDMIWIDENGAVVSIFPDARPCSKEDCPTVKPLKKAKYVLEINGGISTEKGIGVGDEAIFQY